MGMPARSARRHDAAYTAYLQSLIARARLPAGTPGAGRFASGARPGHELDKTFQTANGAAAVAAIVNRAVVHNAGEKGMAEHAMRQRTGQTVRPAAATPAGPQAGAPT
jgi:hypothetical protein